MNYGYFGIAASYAFTIIVTNLILDFYYEKKMGIAVFRYTRDLWPVAVASAIAAVVLSFSYLLIGYTLWAFIVRGLLYSCLFAVLLYILYLNRDEKEKVRNAAKKAFRIIPGIGGAK